LSASAVCPGLYTPPGSGFLGGGVVAVVAVLACQVPESPTTRRLSAPHAREPGGAASLPGLTALAL